MIERGAFEVLGEPFGNVFPRRLAHPLPAVDPRTIALSCLGAYVAGLTFRRPGAVDGPSLEFSIPAERFLIEQPDHEHEVQFPSMVCVATEEEQYDCPGLVSQLDEGSADLFGRGSVLQVQYEQLEFFRLEMWAASLPERRSMIAGMQTSLCPTEQMYGLRLKMGAYYGETVCFTPWALQRRDLDAIRGRRVAAMRIEMRFNVVRLVNVERLQPPQNVVVAGPMLPSDVVIR